MDKIYLPQHLIPKNKTTLFRCGSYNDGGYLLNKNDVLKSDTLISLGIHENWDFEKEIYQNYNIKSMILFDPQTSYFLIFFYLLKSIIKLDVRKIKNYLRKFKELKNLKSNCIFFNTKFKQNLVLEHMKSQNILLKVDIESDEYENLNFFLDYQDNINCLVIEFHDVDNNYKRINNFISKFKLNLIHTHINTFSKKDEVAIELTFSKYAEMSNEKWNQFSLDKIDFPNHPNHKNIKIYNN